MRYLRPVAALAAILTVSAIQAGLVAPVAMILPLAPAISLPAVLVAAVAVVDGAAAGMAFGFTAGLIADLGSAHPAGVLALVWTCLGVVCGMAATGRSVREDVLTCATAAAAAGAVATLILAVVHNGGGASVWSAVREFPLVWLASAVLAAGLVPITRAALRNPALRAGHPVLNDVRVVQRG